MDSEQVRQHVEAFGGPVKTVESFALEVIDVRPRSLEEFIAHVEYFYGGIRLSTKAVCPGHTAPGVVWWKHFSDEVLDSIIVGSRESGKTLGYALLDHMQMHFNGDEIANVGAVEAQAKKCYSYIQKFCNMLHWRRYLSKPSMISETIFKNGAKVEIMPATMNRVNSPHPRIANADEVELMPIKVMNEMVSMPVRQNGRPPAIRYTSSRKKPYGPLEDLLNVAEDRGLTVFTFCVFEVIEQCQPERHLGGEGCKSCPLADDCLYDTVDARGELVKAPGPGRAAKADGWMNIDDVIRQKRVTASEVWQSQWLSKKPMQTGLIYPMFNDDIHSLDDELYDWNPSLPVYAGMDFGFTNPGCILYAQMMPTDELIIFAEDYESARITPRWASAVKKTPWYKNLKWVVGDPAAADGRNTMANAGIPMLAANNEVDNGLARVRYLLEPPLMDRPMLYISKRCKNLRREIKSYHNPEIKENKNAKEEPEKVDDHACDAMRYLVSELYAGRIAI